MNYYYLGFLYCFRALFVSCSKILPLGIKTSVKNEVQTHNNVLSHELWPPLVEH